MKGRWLIGVLVVGFVGLWLGLAAPAVAADKKCPPDSVPSGDTCMDTYENSVWETTDANLIKKIKKGKATLAQLMAGATRRGDGVDDYGAGCPDSGNGCMDFYAVSIPGVNPSCCMTWFQAVAFARNSGKYLPSNQQWQAAALGTPNPGADDDSTDCNITVDLPLGIDPVPTGSRSNCVSDVGAMDMVGNLWEWVADWVPPASGLCGVALFAGDLNCLAGTTQAAGTAALIRGGSFGNGVEAGVFAVSGSFTPSVASGVVGFRAAR